MHNDQASPEQMAESDRSIELVGNPTYESIGGFLLTRAEHQSFLAGELVCCAPFGRHFSSDTLWLYRHKSTGVSGMPASCTCVCLAQAPQLVREML